MNSISDHHLKTKGVSAFKTALEHHQVATIYADGQAHFVVKLLNITTICVNAS